MPATFASLVVTMLTATSVDGLRVVATGACPGPEEVRGRLSALLPADRVVDGRAEITVAGDRLVVKLNVGSSAQPFERVVPVAGDCASRAGTAAVILASFLNDGAGETSATGVPPPARPRRRQVRVALADPTTAPTPFTDVGEHRPVTPHAGPAASGPSDETAADFARFAEAVDGYRRAATGIIERARAGRVAGIRSRYGARIALEEKEERERRVDAVAMLEAFLRKYSSDERWTPDVMFRLAELYYERSSDAFLTEQEAYQKALDSPNPPTTQSPKPDYTQTIDLYRRLVTEFPSYRLLDAAYYLLGFCLGEMGKDAEAKQALIALTCRNRYRPLDPPPTTHAVAYDGCEPLTRESKLVPEAWTRIGEMHFDGGELSLAISAYRRVLDYKDSPYYDKALYKLAWSYYRDNRFREAVQAFDGLVRFADDKRAAGDKFGSDLRPEAVQYLGISFSEPDWDGDTVPDRESGLRRIDRFYEGRENEPHVKEIYQRLGDTYFDQTRYADAIAVYKALLAKWPHFADAPKVQGKVVRALERDRNLVQAAKERELLGRNYARGGEWYRANRDNPEALGAAQQLAEDALLTAATTVHAQAQFCRTQYLQNADPKKLADCQAMYRTAGELYEKYLAAYPDSKRAYELSVYYADAYYYGGKLADAVAAYEAVRDSNLDDRSQQHAALQIIKIHEELIANMKAARQLEEPPLPEVANTRPPVRATPIPEAYRRYVEALDWYVRHIKDDRAPEMSYAAATVFLRYRDWPGARARLAGITTAYCGTKPEVGFRAYDALMQTYVIDHATQDEETKDCALGKLLTIAEEFSESPCAMSARAGDFTARIDAIRDGARAAVASKRLEISIRNDETGGNQQLRQCADGPSGVAMVKGLGTRAPAAGPPPNDIDESAALDLLDVVDRNPRDPNAAAYLNNACVIYERLSRFRDATTCYERLARDYPADALGKEALWNAATNHRRFFELDRAVLLYERIATDPALATSPHRKDALGLAATLLDNDHEYARAADFYRRYSAVPGLSAREAGEAFFAACTAFEKMKDSARERQCLTDLVLQYGPQAEAAEQVVGSYAKLAALAEQSGNGPATLAAYRKVRDEFVARRLAPATPAATAAAKAEYVLLDDRFRAFVARSFPANPAALPRAFERFTAEARTLSDEYRRVWAYKDATWTLASFLRRGDIYYEFAQKLARIAESPPADIAALARRADRLERGAGDKMLADYKDRIYEHVTGLEDEARKQWRATVDKAAEYGVTNEYVNRARENLSRYEPDASPNAKDERIDFAEP